LDLVSLENRGRDGKDQWWLVFWEAKLVENKDLRSWTTPSVVNQLRQYKEWLNNNRDLVITQYQHACCLMVQLRCIAHGIRQDFGRLGEGIMAVAENGPSIDTTPRLLIDERDPNIPFRRDGHLQRLCDEFNVDPASRHSNELDGISFISVRHVKQWRRRSVVGFIQLKSDRGEMSFALSIRIQAYILHRAIPLFGSATTALRPQLNLSS
jgi:hypothetical protein